MSNKKKFCRVIAFLLVTCMLILGVSEGMKGNELTAVCTIKGFYQEEENSLDVVLIGASEVYASYSPTEAWKEFGYTSYSYGCPGVAGNLYQTILAEVLRTQKPKVVAFEINGFIHKDDYATEGRTRNVVDNLRWSSNRVNAIEKVVEKDERINYYLPIMAYHGNWAHPKSMLENLYMKLMFLKSGRSYLKGYAGQSRVSSYEKQSCKGEISFTDKSRQILDELLTYCKEQQIEHVIFFRAPHMKVAKNQEKLQEIWSEVERYGYDVVDLAANLEENGYDPQTDFYNSEHLNIYGMRKFTHQLGSYLTEECGLKVEHSEKTTAEWNLCTEKADSIFAQMEEDIKNGEIRAYNEAAVYHKPSIVKKLED